MPTRLTLMGQYDSDSTMEVKPTLVSRLVKASCRFWLCLTFVTVHYSLALIIFNGAQKSQPSCNWSYTLSIVAYVLTFYRLIWKRKDLSELIRNINDLDNHYDEKKSKIRRNVYLAISVSFVYTVISFGLNLREFFLFENYTEFLSQILFGIQVSIWPTKAIDFLLVVICSMFYLTIYSGGFVFPIYYSYMALSLSDFSQNINDNLLKSSFKKHHEFDGVWLYQTRHQIRHLRSIAFKLNCLFKDLVLLWHVVTLVHSCTGIMQVVGAIGNYNPTLMNIYLLFYCQSLISMIGTAMSASKLLSSNDAIMCSLHSMTEIALDHKKTQELQLTCVGLRDPHIALHAGCFTISMNFCLSILGAGFSYAVVLIQLNPNAMAKLQELTTFNESTLE